MTEPMLCAPAEPTGQWLASRGWIYELKLDGVRIIADKRGRDVDLWYRRGRSATRSYPEIARALADLVDDAVLDGEIIAFDAAGRPSFQRLGQRIGLDRPNDIEGAAKAVPVVYVVFDLLALGERDLRELPLLERRKVLEALVPDAGLVRALEYIPDDGRALFDTCRRERLEGVIAKRASSTYRSGQRSDDWRKIKCVQDEEFVVVGFTRGTGARGDLGALDLASYEGDTLLLRGKAGSGIDDKTMRALVPRLRALAVDAPTARGTYPPAPNGRTHVRPEIVVSVRAGGWSDDGRLRFPVFRGVRVDVDPRDCRAAPPSAAPHEDLAEYYDAVGDVLLRYLRGRSRIGSADELRTAIPPLRIQPAGWMAFDCDATGARALHALADEIGLPAFAKTGDGLDWQVLVPVGDAPPDGARALAELATHLATPGVVRVAPSPILAPYSPVAGAGSRVSTPVPWSDVALALDPRRLTTRTVPARLLEAGDPMAPILDVRVDFAAAVARVEARVARAKESGA